jgi:hypothetical protein
MPERIQRKRVKGWKMPPNTVSVTRPGRWGNPYRASLFRDYTPTQQVNDFKRWIDGDVGARVWAGPPPTCEEIREHLAGKNLARFCRLDQPCHADVLLELATSPQNPEDGK